MTGAGWPYSFSMTAESGCAVIWFMPPGGFGTMIVTARDGYVPCAAAPAAARARTAAESKRFMVPPCFRGQTGEPVPYVAWQSGPLKTVVFHLQAVNGSAAFR